MLWSLYPVSPAAAPVRRLAFHNISEEQGLFQSAIWGIAQDHRGFIWLGTEAGLYRYDGHDFVVYQDDPAVPTSLSSNFVASLFVDRKGNLWAGNLMGLDRFDSSKEQFVHFGLQGEEDTQDKRITKIFEDHLGVIWLGTHEGLVQLDPSTKQSVRYRRDESDPESLCSNHVTSISGDAQSSLWIGTVGGGVCTFNRKSGKFTAFRHSADNPNSLGDDAVSSIHVDRQSRVWIGTKSGMNLFDPTSKSFFKFTIEPDPSSANNWITVILEDSDGTIVAGTQSGHLYGFDTQKKEFFFYGDTPTPINENILSIYEDSSGIVWVGTQGKGVFKVARLKNFFQVKHDPDDPNSLSHNNVFAFHEDKQGRVWVGTNGGGINILDRKTGKITVLRHDPADPSSLSSDFIRQIYEDSSGTVWVGTQGGGLNVMDPSTGMFKHLRHDSSDPTSLSNDAVYAIYEDSRGVLWFGTRGGLNRLNRESMSFTRYNNDPTNPASLNADFVYSFYEDRAGVLWLGTLGGCLNRFNRKKNNFTHFTFSDNASNVYEDQAGRFWVSTNEGLVLLDRATGNYRRFTKEDGLSDNLIFSFEQDDEGFLWLSTNYGLTRFDPNTKETKVFFANDGLQANEFNGKASFKSRSGELFFGGINGFNYFDPKTIREDPYIPPVAITKLLLFNKPVEIGQDHEGRIILEESIIETDELVLNYNDYVVSFEFAALAYANPKGNNYAYRLEGFEDHWNYVGNRRFATYTNLPHGSYTLRVKASNSDDVWNNQGASLRITVIPPYWKTWWFYLLLGSLAVLSVVGTHLYRVRNIEQQRRILKTTVQERTAELTSKKDELERQKSQLEKTLEELEKTKRFLVENAHKAGMAEMATGVLHNVGNLMNSVNVIANMIRDTLRRSRIKERMYKANTLLKDNAFRPGGFEEETASRLVEFYELLEQSLEEEQKEIKDSVFTMIGKLETIMSVVESQQQYATGGQLTERLALVDVVEEALKLKEPSIDRHAIRLEKRYADNPDVLVQRHKLIHVLVNLYENAKHAMIDTDAADKKLIIEVAREDGLAVLTFTDTGCGIEQGDLEKVFLYGFTTREGGHGFGLHTCHNYLKEMKATITAHSAGPGKGAAFRLSFRLADDV